MAETFFEEMKRYVGFGPDDEAALSELSQAAAAHFKRIADEFYDRLEQHESARKIFSGPAQIERLKSTLCDWMGQLFRGPWDESYFQRRARIGRVHVRIGLPQRYMFGAMNLIRLSFTKVAQDVYRDQPDRRHRTVWALQRIFDLELAIMLETYREAYVEQVQQRDREVQRALEERLAVSEARYDEIVEKSEALIVTFESSGKILLFNRPAEDLVGIDRRAAMHRSWFELFVPAEDRGAVAALCDQALSGQRVGPYEATIPCRHGTCRLRWHLTTLPSAGGPVLCAIGLDVSEEHELASRTRRAERLASLGTMAAGLAHEIRNPLNAAHLQLTVVQRRLSRKSSPDVAGALEAAQLVGTEMRRLASLVEEFLQFARPQPLRLAPGDLRTTAEGIVALFEPEARRAGVQLRLAPGEPVPVEMDDERIKQVLLNLMKNAVEALELSGTGSLVEVRVERRGGMAIAEIEDDGPGVPAGEPVFEPFFTTKPEGTGLGLAIAHRIAEDHGGEIAFQTRPGRTVFSLRLPLLAGASQGAS